MAISIAMAQQTSPVEINYIKSKPTEMLDWNEALEPGEETCATDAGSACSSDAESISSVASNERPRAHLTLGLRNIRKQKQFRGTALETIPGTPVASQKCWGAEEADDTESDDCKTAPATDVIALPPPRSPKRSGRPAPIAVEPRLNATFVNKFGTVPVQSSTFSPKKRVRQGAGAADSSLINAVRCGVFGTVPAPANQKSKRSDKTTTPVSDEAGVQSPKKRSKEATMAKARRDGVPLKVRLPDHLASVPFNSSFDLTLPMKKRPVYADAAPDALDSLKKADQTMPVKKCVSPFFLQELPATGASLTAVIVKMDARSSPSGLVRAR